MVKFSFPRKLKLNTKRRSAIRKEFRFKFNLKNLILWSLVAFFVFTFIVGLVATNPEFSQRWQPPQEISLTELMTALKQDEIKKITVENSKLTATTREGTQLISHKEFSQSFLEILAQAKIDPSNLEIEVKETNFTSVSFLDLVATLAPLLLIGFFFYAMFRSAGRAQETLFSFGSSKAKLYDKNIRHVTFNDVAGVDEAKAELAEIVDFLKNPKKYAKVGARTPKGVLLVGPSGVGKTLLARAVAGEAHVPFFSMAGSEFMEMLVGVGARWAKDLFEQAKRHKPSIIFIDEIDAIGRQRTIGLVGAHDEREQTLNQILVEMDGFEPNDTTIVMAATNRADMLDPALLRPGRFDRRIVLDLPDLTGREAILKIHARGKPFASTVNWPKVARRTVGFSGADLENMLNEAAILAARTGKNLIALEEIEEAATRVKLGPEKKRLQSPLDRRMTAYHEAGHAVVAHFLSHLDPVHRVSIVSRNLALGFTLIPPTADRYTETRSQLEEQIISLLGGRAAEELEFTEFTGGAANDIQRATEIARLMVSTYGMSRLGPVNLGPQWQTSEIGKVWYEPSQVSPGMAERVDAEIKSILDRAYKKALSILKKNKIRLDKIAEELLRRETLEGDQFERLIGVPKAALAPAVA